MIIHILSHVHFQTKFHLLLLQGDHFWNPNIWSGNRTSTISTYRWHFFFEWKTFCWLVLRSFELIFFIFVALHQCRPGSHFLEVFFVVGRGARNFSWPVTPTVGRREWRSCRRMFGLHSVLDQGSLHCLLGGIKHCKCMANLSDFHWTVQRLAW